VLNAIIAFSFGDDGYLFFNHRIPFILFLPFSLNLASTSPSLPRSSPCVTTFSLLEFPTFDSRQAFSTRHF